MLYWSFYEKSRFLLSLIFSISAFGVETITTNAPQKKGRLQIKIALPAFLTHINNSTKTPLLLSEKPKPKTKKGK